ncbi:FAD carrier FLX1 [Hyphodiscus hymeniophilus]|uniref:FAD carrier FLX1 n=1 Tax=Hyphodiscus hymeniophilus TaxID=353542 RepID=A0A9P6VHP2_9HELO|nr:FAD carrier FLX1 [Hyphodiscus hymeniophilus]
MNENHARLSPALVETIAGLSAGTISTLVVHPLDVVKTRLQILRNTSKTPVSGFGIFKELISKQEPIQSLYRGLTPNLIGNASSWAIFFYFKSVIEKQLLIFHSGSSSGALTGNDVSDTRNTLTPIDYFLASGISGTMITMTTNPIWVLKTRMLSSDKGTEGAYESMWQGATHVWQTEGPRGFYRGAGVSLLGNSHGAVQFAVYEPLKKVWRRYIARAHDSNKDARYGEEKLGNSATLVISGTSKVVAGTVTYPYQVLRSRLQTYNSEERFGKGIRGVVGKVWREEGWKGFYKGLGTNIVRVLPATWVTFLVYENVRYYLPRLEDERDF